MLRQNADNAESIGNKQRKRQLLECMEALIDDVTRRGDFGEFGVTFTAQAGQIGHYKQNRETTFK